MKDNRRQRKINLITILIIAIIVVSFITQLMFFKNGNSVLDEYAKREINEEVADLIYIGEDQTALAAVVSGNNETIAVAKAAFILMNDIRKDEGLKPLKWSGALDKAASVRAEEVTKRWSHKRPDSSVYWSVNADAIYGENISKGYRTAESAVDSWMKSEAHRENILDDDYNTVAIAVYEDKNGNWYWATEFGL